MKSKYTLLLLLYLLFSAISTNLKAQLTPGDIAFVGFNSQNPDAFSIATLTDLAKEDTIYFTDNGWLSSGSLRNGEGTIDWIIPAGGIPKGSVVLFENNSGWNATSGTVSGGVTLASSGDQILAYTGDQTNPNFIAAIQFSNDAWDIDEDGTSYSALPAGLTNDSTAVAISETENAIYCGSYSGNKTEELILINNPARWYRNDSQSFDLAPDFYPFEVFSDAAGTNDWNTATNWITFSIPNSDVSVIIPNDKTAEITGLPAANCKNLIIEPEGFLIVESGNTLNVINNLKIKSYSITKTGGISGSGNITVLGISTIERYMPGDCWHIISSPVQNQTLGSFATNQANSIQFNSTYNNYDLAPYDETMDEWTPYTLETNTNNLETGKGYVVYRTESGNVSFSGNINLKDTSVTLTKNNYGWNGVGNPFPAAILGTGSNSFLSTNSQCLDSAYAALYIWDEDPNSDNGDYITYTAASSQKLAIGQGFIVKSKSDGEKLIFSNSMITESAPSFKSGQTEPVFIRLTASTNNFSNSTEVYFNDNMTIGLDPTFDAGKLKGNPDFYIGTQLINNSSIDLAVQSLPYPENEEFSIPLILHCKNGGEVTFSAEQENLPVDLPLFLYDNKNNSLTQFGLTETNYTTFVNANEPETGRFFLLTSETLATPQTTQLNEEIVSVQYIDKTILIRGYSAKQTTFKLTGTDGKIHIIKKADSSNINRIQVHHIPSGIYLLNIQGPHQNQTKKIVISN